MTGFPEAWQEGIPVDDCESIGPGAIRKNGRVIYGPVAINVPPEQAAYWKRLEAAMERLANRPPPVDWDNDDVDYDVSYEEEEPDP